MISTLGLFVYSPATNFFPFFLAKSLIKNTKGLKQEFLNKQKSRKQEELPPFFSETKIPLFLTLTQRNPKSNHFISFTESKPTEKTYIQKTDEVHTTEVLPAVPPQSKDPSLHSQSHGLDRGFSSRYHPHPYTGD